MTLSGFNCVSHLCTIPHSFSSRVLSTCTLESLSSVSFSSFGFFRKRKAKAWKIWKSFFHNPFPVHVLQTEEDKKWLSVTEIFDINRVSCRPLAILRGDKSKFNLCVSSKPSCPLLDNLVQIVIIFAKLVHVHCHFLQTSLGTDKTFQ